MSVEDPNELTDALWDNIVRMESIQGVLAEYAELGLDAVLDEGVLRDIPVVGTLVALARAGVGIRDRLFAKKLLRFLLALDKAPQEERREQIERLASDMKERQHVGEQLILLLDRMNDMRKAEILAFAFEALLREEIDRAQFQGLAQVIDMINPDLIPVYAQRRSRGFCQRIEPNAETAHFFQCGLVTIRFAKIGRQSLANVQEGHGVFPGGVFTESELGNLFYKFVARKMIEHHKTGE